MMVILVTLSYIIQGSCGNQFFLLSLGKQEILSVNGHPTTPANSSLKKGPIPLFIQLYIGDTYFSHSFLIRSAPMFAFQNDNQPLHCHCKKKGVFVSIRNHYFTHLEIFPKQVLIYVKQKIKLIYNSLTFKRKSTFPCKNEANSKMSIF